MTAAELAEACGGRLSGAVADGWRLGRVTSDSRATQAGDVFVALCGPRFDGNDFIDDAVSRGASLVVCLSGRALDRRGVAFVEVEDTLRALGDLAAAKRRRFDLPVIAITGSNGKTTTKELLRSVLEQALGPESVLATRGNYNNLIGLPLTLLGLREQHRAAIVEMGMNAPGEIARLTEIARPSHGLVTCVAEAHLGGLGSLDAIAKAKGELYVGLAETATAIFNRDDPLVVREVRRFDGAKLGFGSGGRVRAGRVDALELDRCRFELIYGESSLDVELGLGGRHNVTNAVAAAACAFALEVEASVVGTALGSASLPPMRLDCRRLANGVVLVDDAYNANPASLRAALAAMRDGARGRVLVVLGDMLELGGEAERIHAESGHEVAALAPALFCALGDFAEHLIGGAAAAGLDESACHVASDHLEAARMVAERWRKGDTVLVKGSRGAEMDQVVRALAQRGES